MRNTVGGRKDNVPKQGWLGIDFSGQGETILFFSCNDDFPPRSGRLGKATEGEFRRSLDSLWGWEGGWGTMPGF